MGKLHSKYNIYTSQDRERYAIKKNIERQKKRRFIQRALSKISKEYDSLIKKEDDKLPIDKTLIKASINLNKKPAKSEIWFKEMYKHNLVSTDLSNIPFYNMIIPDILNHYYKYVIEVDGSWHLRTDIIEQDKHKDRFYRSKGYVVFRVKAFNVDSFYMTLYRIVERRIKFDKKCGKLYNYKNNIPEHLLEKHMKDSVNETDNGLW